MATCFRVGTQTLAVQKNLDLAITESWWKMLQWVSQISPFLVQGRPLVSRRDFDNTEEIWSAWEADNLRNPIRFYLVVFLDSSQFFSSKAWKIASK